MSQLPESGDFPRRITLELTNQCNISCTFCPRHTMGGELGIMPTSLALKLIDEMAEHPPVCLVPFFRGEPLLHPDWHHILSHAVKKGLAPVQFTTNGTLLTPENAALLLDTGIHFLSFSLDTLDPALYEASRRKARFAQTMENIHAFLRLHEERRSSMQVQVSAVETDAHKAGMAAFVEYWQPRVDRVRVYMEHSKDGRPGSLAGVEIPEQRLPCKKIYTDMIIYWNGEVGICNHDWQRPATGPRMGDVSATGIAAVWNSPAYTELRRRHEGGGELEMPCSACGHWLADYLEAHLLGRVYTGGGQTNTHPGA